MVQFFKGYLDLALYHIGTSALITARSLDILIFLAEKNFKSSPRSDFGRFNFRGFALLIIALDHGARARSSVSVVEKITDARCRRRWFDTGETEASQSFARGKRGKCRQ